MSRHQVVEPEPGLAQLDETNSTQASLSAMVHIATVVLSLRTAAQLCIIIIQSFPDFKKHPPTLTVFYDWAFCVIAPSLRCWNTLHLGHRPQARMQPHRKSTPLPPTLKPSAPR